MRDFNNPVLGLARKSKHRVMDGLDDSEAVQYLEEVLEHKCEICMSRTQNNDGTLQGCFHNFDPRKAWRNGWCEEFNDD